MSEQSQIVTILRALEERITSVEDTLAVFTARLTAFDAARIDPDGEIRTALYDILRVRSTTAQSAEVIAHQRDQVLALTDVVAMLLGRLIELIRLSTAQHAETLGMLHTLARELDQAAIADAAAAARQRIYDAEEEQAALLAHHADMAIDLLARARSDARGVVRQAVDRATDMIEAAEETARERLAEEQESA